MYHISRSRDMDTKLTAVRERKIELVEMDIFRMNEGITDDGS